MLNVVYVSTSTLYLYYRQLQLQKKHNISLTIGQKLVNFYIKKNTHPVKTHRGRHTEHSIEINKTSIFLIQGDLEL